jgi:hypothetical protein
MLEGIRLETVLRCAAARWTPLIGDPTLAGWVTVTAYLACMALAVAVWRRAPLRAERWFWGLLALTMAALAVNRQLDLHAALTATGRCLAQLQGWYTERYGFQQQVLLALLAGGLVCLGGGLWLLRRHLRHTALALSGLAVLAGLVAVRTVGFHPVEAMLATRVLQEVRFGSLVEMAGLGLIALNALLRLRGSPRGRKGYPRPPVRR